MNYDAALISHPRRWLSKLFRSKQRSEVNKEPESLPRLQVVLDMDECMLCCEDAIGKDSFALKPRLETITIQTTGANSRLLRFHLRPGLREFLRSVSEFADMYVMTAAQAAYAYPAIAVIDQERKIFKEIITRENFDFENGKDLSALGDRFNKRRTVLVDNADYNFSFQPSNGLLVREFYDNEQDEHLLDVLSVLNVLQHAPDVRKVLKPSKISGRNFHLFADEIAEGYEM